MQAKPRKPVRPRARYALACKQTPATQCARAPSPRWLTSKTLQPSARQSWRGTGLQANPCKLVRPSALPTLACKQTPATQCVPELATHWLASKTLQSSAPPPCSCTGLQAKPRKLVRPHAGLQANPCNPVRHRLAHALACKQTPASWCARAPSPRWLASKPLQAGASAHSLRTGLRTNPCNPVHRRSHAPHAPVNHTFHLSNHPKPLAGAPVSSQRFLAYAPCVHDCPSCRVPFPAPFPRVA